MSDRLTFSWFVGTCNLSHPATGPQEALWNTVKADSHFYWPISLKIAGNVQNSKNRIPLFWFEYFLVFLTMHGCLTFQDYQIFTVYRIEHREFKSVEIFFVYLFWFLR